MKLSVATNFDPELVDRSQNYNVSEFYGKLATDIVGGGRSSYMLTPISRRKFEKHVQYVRSKGFGFNYLLNAACLDNMEITRSGQKSIRSLLDWVCKIDCTAVTVANPLLLKTIKSCYPQLKVRVSVFAGVDHLRKAKYWEDQGADVICLDSLTVNREFDMLRSLRKGLSCDLELLTNNNCLQSCPLSQTHMNLLAHSSQSKHKEGGFVVDHCILECSKMKLRDPVNFIRSDWIRPEDIHHYEAIGYERFKLVERNLPTAVMLQRIQAYSDRKFNGNLLELIQPYGHKKSQGQQKVVARKLFWTLGFLFRPTKIRLGKLGLLHQLAKKRGMLQPLEGDSPVYVDNRELDGFLNRFLKHSCRDVNCDDCQYCHKFAAKAVKVNPSYQQECMKLHNEIDDNLVSGKFWQA